MQTSVVFPAKGIYYAKLTVSDGKGKTSTDTLRIDIENAPPVPIIVSPKEGTTFAVGDILTLTGLASDEEEGFLADDQLSWEVRQHHNVHYHPLLSGVIGNNIELQQAPEHEDFDAATTSYLEIILTVTSLDGRSASVSRNVMPRLATLHFDTVPSGLSLVFYGEEMPTPVTIVSWESSKLTVKARNESYFHFDSWSDETSESTREFVTPESTPGSPLVATSWIS
mmetsp:Transcript_21727/g.22084  ORF Transcript_21727/g.22084 Transcript_21727/m.22084 type:complete len:225 (-) Transcript_21727:304-978(-)